MYLKVYLILCSVYGYHSTVEIKHETFDTLEQLAFSSTYEDEEISRTKKELFGDN